MICSFKNKMAAPRRKLFSSILASSILTELLDEDGSIPSYENTNSDEDSDYVPDTQESNTESSDEEALEYTTLMSTPSRPKVTHSTTGTSTSCEPDANEGPDMDTATMSLPPLAAVQQGDTVMNDSIEHAVQNEHHVENTETMDNRPDMDTATMSLPPLAAVQQGDTVMNDSIEHAVQNEHHVENTETRDNRQISRKRKRNPTMWMRNVAKAKRQAGEEYTSTRTGKNVPQRAIKKVKDCNECRFRCSQKISEEEQQQIHQKFWSLSDEGKTHFYSEFTERVEKARNRGKDNLKPKTYSYTFFLRSGSSTIKERVCKDFFLTTLDISKARVSYFYTNRRCVETGLPLPSKIGKYPKKKTGEDQIAQVKAHIESFPKVPSHYCRQGTSKEYLEKALNLTKMYGLYKDWCTENEAVPVKQHKYTEIFNTEFNIGFMAPKKDRCDRCELGKMSSELPPAEQEALKVHHLNKEKAYKERERDRNDKTKAVVCFDLENVFSLPISGVSNFFYKRKLTTLNMTAHLSLTRKSYFTVWNEGNGGRGGNNMASAVVRILEGVMADNPEIKELTLWSDSCVSQNRNSIMTLALSLFLNRHPNLDSITQKFCEAGHSNIQEVDSVHSVIERHLRHQEIFSPLGLVRKLSTIKNTQTIQMTEFLDYQAKAKKEFQFSRVPYSQVRQLKISKVTGVVLYKLHHDPAADWTVVSVKLYPRSTRKGQQPRQPQETPLKRLAKPTLSLEKKKDIGSMLQYMPEIDRICMKNFAS